MAIRLETATAAHATPVELALLRGMNSAMLSERWRRLFQPRWGAEDRPLGSVLLDDERIVGFAAFVHARLPRPGGADAWLCNISSWVTAPGYAAQALSLVMPVLKLPNTTVTNLTPIPSVHAIFSRLGFVPLESATRLLYPTLAAPAGWRADARETDLARILSRLPSWEARVAQDHEGLVQHLWIPGPDGQHCYLQYERTRRRRLPAAKLLWVTPGTLPAAAVAVRRALFRVAGAVLVECEERMAGSGPLRGSWRVPLPQPRLFRPAGLTPADVPSAYSEMPLLGI